MPSCALVVQRSILWPVAVGAPEFVEHYQIGEGESEAVLVRGPGPRMLTFHPPAPARSPARRSVRGQHLFPARTAS